MRALLVGLFALCLCAASPRAAAETLFIEAGLVLTVDGPPIPKGRILVRDGKIAEVGAAIERPAFSRLIDARELTVSPGFVVAQSAIGQPRAQSPSGPPDRPIRVSTSAEAKGIDEVHPLHGDFARLLQQGITTIGLSPVATGSGLRGQVSAISTRTGTIDGMTIAAEAAVLLDVDAHGAWRRAMSEVFDKAEETAKKEADEEAARKKGRAAKASKPGGPSKDPLVRVVTKKQPLHLMVDGGSTFAAAEDSLPLADCDVVVLDYGSTWEVADRLAKAGVRVVTSPLLVNRPRTRIPVNRAAEYERAGLPFAFRLPSDDVAGAEVLRDQAIEMARTGASREAVLRALTLEGAKALGLGETVGSITKGRRADLLFWSDHPLEPLARLERIQVAGRDVALTPRASLEDLTRSKGGGA